MVDALTLHPSLIGKLSDMLTLNSALLKQFGLYFEDQNGLSFSVQVHGASVGGKKLTRFWNRAHSQMFLSESEFFVVFLPFSDEVWVTALFQSCAIVHLLQSADIPVSCLCFVWPTDPDIPPPVARFTHEECYFKGVCLWNEQV